MGETSMIENDYISENHRQAMLKRIALRRSRGESDKEITGIQDQHSYYRTKLCDGLIAGVSYTIYDRVMGCSQEDA